MTYKDLIPGVFILFNYNNPLRLCILSLLITLFLTSCASHLISFRDEETNAYITRMRGNRLAGGFTSVELNAQKFEKEGNLSYSLIIVYSGPAYLNIDPGKSLVLIIDGERHEITGSGSGKHREFVSFGLVEETAYYHDIDPDLIRRISQAKKIDVELHYSTKALKRYLTTKNINRFKEFYNTYIVNNKGPSEHSSWKLIQNCYTLRV
jgi:hypothetical protein